MPAFAAKQLLDQIRQYRQYRGLQPSVNASNAKMPVKSARTLLPLTHRQTLRRPADQPLLVIQRGLCETAAVARKMGAGVQANPFPHGAAQQVDAEVGVDKEVGRQIQNGADAVA